MVNDFLLLFLRMNIQWLQTNFEKENFFFSSVVSVLLPKINWSHSHGSILGISMMLHGCVCQVVHLYQL